MGFPPDQLKLITAAQPKINEDVAHGLARKHLNAYARKAIDEAFKLLSERYPSALRYIGLRECTPLEEMHALTRRTGPTRTYDLAATDAEVLAVMHEFNGVRMPDVYVPRIYCGIGGSISISDSVMRIKPVNADAVLSVTGTSVFARLTKTKLTFNPAIYAFETNEGENGYRSRREVARVIWSHIFNGNNVKTKGTRGAKKTCLAAYLFADKGVRNAFQQYAGAEVRVGVVENSEAFLQANKGVELEEINEEKFPRDKWVICSPVGVISRRSKYRTITPLRLVIEKTKFNNFTKCLIAGFFYTIEEFADYRLSYEWDQPRSWRMMIGFLLRGPDFGPVRVNAEMEEHIRSIEGYYDPHIGAALRRQGYSCESFFDFLALVVQRFNHLVVNNDKRGNSMEGKVLTVIPYAMFDVIAAINNMGFELAAPSNHKDMASALAVMRKHLRLTLVYDLVRGRHGEVDTATSPNDSVCFKATLDMVPQAQTNGTRQDSADSERVDSTWVTCKQIVCTSKSAPAGGTRVNPFVQLSPAHEIVIPEEHRELLENTQKYLTARTLASFGVDESLLAIDEADND